MNSAKITSQQRKNYPYFPLMVVIHATSCVIDAGVTVTLASSALFSLNINDARLSIFFSLVGTMAPFVLLAPTASMLVEKIKVPRIVLAVSINCFRCAGLVFMAMASSNSSTTRLAIFPLAFVMLTLSKCYSVAKTTTLPQITTVESFPYFSSRLSMTTGIVSVVAGSILLASNRVFSESTTLYLAFLISAFGIIVSVISYSRLGHKIVSKQIDADKNAIADTTLGKIDERPIDLKPANQTRAIKALFTFGSAIRFMVGLLTIGIALKFRDEKLILGLCFAGASIASFLTNTFAVSLNNSKIGFLANYFALAALTIFSFCLLFISSNIIFLALVITIGSVGAYIRVTYESKIAAIVPSFVSAKIIARGEVWMQLCWVAGAAVAVISYRPVVIGVLCVAACLLSTSAFSSMTSSISRERN